MFVDARVSNLVDSDQMPKVRTYTNILDCEYYGEGPKKALAGPDYKAFISNASEEYVPLKLEDENDLIAIDYTSGTTGMPKG